jgi:hydroxymethylpyrimidine pyrophosphatase-like HAD family hydrolase
MRYLALASDYDGTLAKDGHVEETVLHALSRLRASGRKLVLVTGRELPELKAVFAEINLCDVVVAENGGLLYWPNEQREEVIAEAPPEALVQELMRLDVKPFSVGRVVLATWRPHETKVLEAIQSLGLGHQIIFNKRAVMVLPTGVNKASGLRVALERLKILPEQTVAVGDAENDHAFLDWCAVAAAVENALPALKDRSDIVLTRDHGHGVVELIERILADDLQSLGPRKPRTAWVESATISEQIAQPAIEAGMPFDPGL